jgi:hypothetical protein
MMSSCEHGNEPSDSIRDGTFFNYSNKIWLLIIKAGQYRSMNIVSILFLQGNFEEMEDSAETSIAVFFGLQGIPNALEDSENPKVRYHLIKLRVHTLHFI